MDTFFEVLTPEKAVLNGHHKIDAAQVEAACKPGRAAKLGSDSELEVAGAGEKSFGLMYGLHGEKYDVLVNDSKAKRTTFKPGSYVTVVQGNFVGQMSADCFAAGALPAVGTSVYVGVSGLLDTSVSGSAVGVVTAHDALQDGYGSTVDIARLHFDIPVV